MRIRFLDFIRAFAIILVVVAHTVYYNNISKGLYDFLDFICRFAVPIFFMADGFLFAIKVIDDRFVYRDYIKNSYFRLVVPWFAFSFIYFISRLLLELNNVFSVNIILNNSFSEILCSIYSNKYAHQLYFLISLFLVRLITWFIYRLVLINIIYVIILVTGYCLFCTIFYQNITDLLVIPGGEDPVYSMIFGLQYFLIGIIIYRIKDHIIDETLFLLFPLLAIDYYFPVYLIVTSVTCIFISFLIFEKTFMKFPSTICYTFLYIGRNTMEIYLIHAPLMLPIINKLCINIIKNQTIKLILMIVMTVLLSIVISNIIKKFSFGRFILGQRG